MRKDNLLICELTIAIYSATDEYEYYTISNMKTTPNIFLQLIFLVMCSYTNTKYSYISYKWRFRTNKCHSLYWTCHFKRCTKLLVKLRNITERNYREQILNRCIPNSCLHWNSPCMRSFLRKSFKYIDSNSIYSSFTFLSNSQKSNCNFGRMGQTSFLSDASLDSIRGSCTVSPIKQRAQNP